jgi:hypothetical protein
MLLRAPRWANGQLRNDVVIRNLAAMGAGLPHNER